MFDKVEFSDLYKFKTSIGLILIGLGIILSWLFLKQDSELLISYEEYYNLIPQSKTLFDKKLSLTSDIIAFLPYISLLLIIVGIILTILGYCKWNTKQKIADATEKINYDNLKAGIKSQSGTEILETADKDVKDELKYKSDEELLNESKEKVEPNKEVKEDIKKGSTEIIEKPIEELKDNLINMENLFLEKITTYNSFNYKVKSQVKVANTYEVDFLLNAFDTKKHNDLIIEIKYLQSKLTMQLIRDAFNKGMHIHSLYYNSTKRSNRFILIVIYKEDIAEKEELSRFLKAVEEYIIEINSNTHKIIVMSDKEAKDYQIQNIIK